MIKVEGRICWIADAVQHSEKYSSRKFVVETSDQYPQKILIQVTNERCNIPLLQLNNNVCCDVNLKGREWVSPSGELLFFNTIEAWRISEIVKNESAGVQQNSTENINTNQYNDIYDGMLEDDDLPF